MGPRTHVTKQPTEPPESELSAATRFLEQIDEERLRELYRYWNELRGNRFAPSYAEVDPVAIPGLLPYLLVTQVEEAESGRRYRYRLCGAEVEQSFGCSMRGRYIDDLMQGRYRDYILGLYDRLVDQGSPIYTVSVYYNRTHHTKRLMLPLSRDGKTVDMVLSGQTFQWSSGSPRPVMAVQDEFEPAVERSGR